MILEGIISNVVDQQKHRLLSRNSGMKRVMSPAFKSSQSHALIISGIRRCGKSTLLLQMIKELDNETSIYLNFESPQLYNFTMPDFSRLDNVIAKRGAKVLFFDEMRIVRGWELYVRQKLDEGYEVIITGSNATLLSTESGTKLTGRHITRELFPFSYSEFLMLKNIPPSEESMSAYISSGGFPEYLKTGDEEQLSTLFEDVLIRDIVARYGIKDIKNLQRLASYLFSNIANRVTATKLKQPLGIKATTTILSWFSYLELSYLVFFLPVYSKSLKAQLINPRKIYAIDTGLVEMVTSSLDSNSGYKLENVIYLHLRRKYRELYYFHDKTECDFVAIKNGVVRELLQVCYDLTPDNLDREVSGLVSAMKYFNLSSGHIITLSITDTIQVDDLSISIIPAHVYLTMDM